MTRVSTQSELIAAIAAQETDIVVTANFEISETQTINYAVTIASEENASYTLTKATNFDNSLFSLNTNTSILTLQNIIIDGAKQTHTEAGNPQALISLLSGSLILGAGAALQNNIASNGGGVYSTNSADNAVSFTMSDNATISGNIAINNGGGIYLSLNSSAVSIGAQAVIQNNEATLGGGIYYEQLNDQSTDELNISGTAKIIGNKASTGGGVYILSGSARFADNAVISDNTATNAGGIAFYGKSIFIDDNVNVINNTASNNAGGLFLSANNVNNTDISLHGLFQGNTANITGGAHIENLSQGSLDISRARFISNLSNIFSISSGGLFISRNSSATTPLTIIMDNTIFNANQSKDSGGGMRVEHNIPAILNLSADSCQFENNSTSNDGGGLYITAGESSSVSIQNSSFIKNQCSSGGGLAFQHNNSEQMSITLQNNVFKDNYTGLGGGIYFGNGNMNAIISSCTFDNNTAEENGGGLYTGGGNGLITALNNTNFVNNKVYGNGGAIIKESRATLLENATFTNNTATRSGSDIFSIGDLHVGLGISLNDGLSFSNTASAPTIVQHLSADSIINLESNYYIASNPQGTPVTVAKSDLTLVPQDAAAFKAPAEMAGWGARLNDSLNEVELAPITYKLTYENTKGAINPNPDNYTVVTDTVNLADLTDITGYSFNGWYDMAEGGTRITEIPRGSIGDKTLYAQWQADLNTVTYYGNDSGGPTAENIPLPQSVEYGETVTLSSEIPTRSGYLFLNWDTEQSGTGIAYSAGDSIPNVQSNINLYAQWRLLPPIIHRLTYHGNDSDGPSAQNIPDAITVADGQSIKLSPSIPTRKGYRFLGWNTQPNGTGITYLPNSTIGPITADSHLYAQWQALQIKYVCFNANDCCGPRACCLPCPLKIYENQSAFIPCCVPCRPCFVFIGWNTRSDGCGTWYYPNQLITVRNRDKCLYAQWSQC